MNLHVKKIDASLQLDHLARQNSVQFTPRSVGLMGVELSSS